MSGQDTIPRRAEDGLDWIDHISDRFSAATGWPLTFRPQDPAASGSRTPETCWASDIRRGDEVLGKLQIDLPADPGRDPGFQSTCELGESLSSLISQLVTACDRLERKSNDVALLLDMARPRDPAERPIANELREFLRVAAELTGFWGAAFFLLTPDGRELRLRAGHRVQPEEIPQPVRPLEMMPPDVRALAGEDFTINASGDSIYRRWLPAQCPTGHCVAVRTPAGPAGVLWLFDRRERTIDADESRTIQTIAAQLAGALERVVLLRESEVHHRQNHDLQVASQCHLETVVPQQTSQRDFETAAICSSRYELGGDLCDVIPLDERRTLVAVGDASGDSVPAAMVMSAVRGALRAMLEHPREELSPDEMMARVNRSLHGLSATFQFMSLFLGLFDFRARTLTYCNAGHPFPLLLLGDELRELPAHGMLLGVLPDTRYRSTTVAIHPGEIFAAYTDGYSEATGADENMFGASRIRAALQSAPGATAADVLESVERTFDEFVDSAGDDRTFFVLKVADALPAE